MLIRLVCCRVCDDPFRLEKSSTKLFVQVNLILYVFVFTLLNTEVGLNILCNPFLSLI